MIKVFIPANKGKIKSSVRGFWRNDSGITYYDYLKIVNTSYIEPRQLEVLKKRYNQEAISFIDTSINCLKIYYSNNKIEVLPYRIYAEILRHNLKSEIKEALKIDLKLFYFRGITIYKIGNKYFKEIFYK
jgi:hypothetical protein